MNQFTKTYIITDVTPRLMAMIRSTTQTFNDRKFGRNRRGTVKLIGCSGSRRGNGLWEVRLVFATGTPLHITYGAYVDGVVIAKYKAAAYQLTDFRKLMRLLAKLQWKPELLVSP